MKVSERLTHTHRLTVHSPWSVNLHSAWTPSLGTVEMAGQVRVFATELCRWSRTGHTTVSVSPAAPPASRPGVHGRGLRHHSATLAWSASISPPFFKGVFPFPALRVPGHCASFHWAPEPITFGGFPHPQQNGACPNTLLCPRWKQTPSVLKCIFFNYTFIIEKNGKYKNLS